MTDRILRQLGEIAALAYLALSLWFAAATFAGDDSVVRSGTEDLPDAVFGSILVLPWVAAVLLVAVAVRAPGPWARRAAIGGVVVVLLWVAVVLADVDKAVIAAIVTVPVVVAVPLLLARSRTS